MSMEERRARELLSIKHSFHQITPLLDDPEVTSIFISQQGKVSFRKFGKEIEDFEGYISEETKQAMLVQIANLNNITINKLEYPVFDGTIPIYNARICGIFPPVAEKGVDIAIRKPPVKIFTLEDYVSSGRMTQNMYEQVITALDTRLNIVISGGTNTGKTTFFNACLEYLNRQNPTKRYYILQDTAELICKAKYASFITTTEKSRFPRLIEASLRFEPDRIFFGEVRDGNVMNTFLTALNTGHAGGICTIHANSAELTLLRIYQLLKQVIIGDILEIREMVNIIIHLQKDSQVGVKVASVMDTSPYSNEFVKTGFQEALKELEALHSEGVYTDN